MAMPQDVSLLQGLTELDLRDNLFVCPPGTLRERFPNLQKVRLRGNPGCETGVIPAELADGCSLVALQAHLRVLQRCVLPKFTFFFCLNSFQKIS